MPLSTINSINRVLPFDNHTNAMDKGALNCKASNALINFSDDVKKEIQLIKNQLNEDLYKFPKVEPGEEGNDALLYQRQKIESEILALMSSRPLILPDDEDTLINLAKEQSQLSKVQTADAIAHQREVNEKLRKVKLEYEQLLNNAKEINENLQKVIDNSNNEMDKINSMKHRYTLYGALFHELRLELKWFLLTRFRAENNDYEQKTMETLLESLTKQFLDNPNDPYIEYDPEIMKSRYISFLIKANLISRHPKDFFQIKLEDFRKSS